MIIDQFGHCVKCGKNLITERVINLEVKKVTTPDYDQVQFELDDGSMMRVVMCKSCKAILKDSDHKNIMKSVVAGWQKEVNRIDHWDGKKKKDHMKVYKKKKIKSKVKEKKHGSHI